MKTKFILSFLIALIFIPIAISKTFTVVNAGYTFSPSVLNINVGDTVIFTLASIHDVAEVNKDVWDADGSTSNGGFSLGFGGGTLVFNKVGTFYYVCQPHAGMGMKGTITVNGETFIQNISKQVSFSLYPNPTSDKLTTELNYSVSGNSQITIFDITGKQLMNENFINSEELTHTIDVSKLNSGKYFIHYTINNNSYTQSFVKIKR